MAKTEYGLDTYYIGKTYFFGEVVRCFLLTLAAIIIGYSLVGTCERVDEIKQRAPEVIAARNWEVIRYEGYAYGSWGNHGGKVWYHVKDLGHKNTYYRVYLTLWNDEVHFHYRQPEQLHRLNVDEG